MSREIHYQDEVARRLVTSGVPADREITTVEGTCFALYLTPGIKGASIVCTIDVNGKRSSNALNFETDEEAYHVFAEIDRSAVRAKELLTDSNVLATENVYGVL